MSVYIATAKYIYMLACVEGFINQNYARNGMRYSRLVLNQSETKQIIVSDLLNASTNITNQHSQ